MSTIGPVFKLLWLEIDAWGILGLAAQGWFFTRFLVQWIASERRGHSYVPIHFWWISLTGGGMLLVYVIGRRDVPLILGQSVGLFVYIRNLIMIYRKRRLEKAAAVEPGDALYIHPNNDDSGEPTDHAPDEP